MSSFGEISIAILSAIDTALTLGGSRDGYISYAKIPADQFPFAMVFNPAKNIERGQFQHGVETTLNPVVVVWHSVDISVVNAGIVSIEDQIASDPTLSSKVEDCWVATAERAEGIDTTFTAAVLTIETRGSV